MLQQVEFIHLTSSINDSLTTANFFQRVWNNTELMNIRHVLGDVGLVDETK